MGACVTGGIGSDGSGSLAGNGDVNSAGDSSIVEFSGGCFGVAAASSDGSERRDRWNAKTDAETTIAIPATNSTSNEKRSACFGDASREDTRSAREFGGRSGEKELASGVGTPVMNPAAWANSIACSEFSALTTRYDSLPVFRQIVGTQYFRMAIHQPSVNERAS